MLSVKGKLKVDRIESGVTEEVLFDFTAADENQLSMNAGDIILWNDGELKDDWILCSFRDQVLSALMA